VTKDHAKILTVAAVTVGCEFGTLYLIAYLKDDRGSMLPSALLFPIACLLSIPHLHVIALAIIAMLAQFPVYGYLAGRAWMRGHLGRTLLRLSAVHFVSVVASLCSLPISRV
jgi:hypothetical protein